MVKKLNRRINLRETMDPFANMISDIINTWNLYGSSVIIKTEGDITSEDSTWRSEGVLENVSNK